jgi:hypothetical protein
MKSPGEKSSGLFPFNRPNAVDIRGNIPAVYASQKRIFPMTSFLVLSALLSGFGWALAAVLLGAVVAYFCRDSLVTLCESAIDYSGLDVEEISAIEEARAELAENHRVRAQKAREAAERSEAASMRAVYLAAWEGDWQSEALHRIATLDISQLSELPGIGGKRARRIVDAGPLTLESLRAICTRPVAERTMALV